MFEGRRPFFRQELARNECVSHHGAENLETTRLNYIRWCNKEAMRMFPVAPFITRILADPLEIDGYKLPASKAFSGSALIVFRQAAV